MPGSSAVSPPTSATARLAAHLGGALDELRDRLEVDPVRRDVVEEEQRVGAARRDVVDAVRGEIGAARPQRARAARARIELRPDRVGRRSEEPLVVERIEARERAEARRAGRLDGRAQSLDDGVGLRDRDAGSRVRLPRRPRAECTVHGDVDEPSLLTSWTFDPLQLAPIALIAVAYAVRARTLARRGQPVPGWRIALFALGIALLVVAVASPIAAVGEEELFSFHMAQHLLLGDLAPLCLLAGLTGPLLRPILALPGVMRLRVLANPFVALPIWAANLVLWHVPVFYEAAVEHERRARARAHRLLQRRHRPLAARARDAARAGVVRDGREARVHRRRPARRDRHRQRLRLGRAPRSTTSTRRATTTSASRPAPTRASPAR